MLIKQPIIGHYPNLEIGKLYKLHTFKGNKGYNFYSIDNNETYIKSGEIMLLVDINRHKIYEQYDFLFVFNNLKLTYRAGIGSDDYICNFEEIV